MVQLQQWRAPAHGISLNYVPQMQQIGSAQNAANLANTMLPANLTQLLAQAMPQAAAKPAMGAPGSGYTALSPQEEAFWRRSGKLPAGYSGGLFKVAPQPATYGMLGRRGGADTQSPGGPRG